MNHMDGVTATVDATMTVAEIDRALAELRADQASTDDVGVAAAIERRCLALDQDRRVAVVVAHAHARRLAAVRGRAARVGLEQLERELPSQLRARACDLDDWAARGVDLVEAYRTTLTRLEALHDLPLQPAVFPHEFDITEKRQRLAPQPLVTAALARAGIVAFDGPPVTWDPTSTIERVVVSAVAKVFATARQRLPPVTDEAPT